VRAVLCLAGLYGVSVFFILSGYSLAHAYEPRFRDKLTRDDVGHYFLRRVGRLGPLFAVVTLVSIAGKLLVTGKPVDVFSTLANLTLTFGLVNSASTPVVGGWSIGIEVVFYLLLPFLILLRRNSVPIVLVSMFVAAWLARDIGRFGSLPEGWGLYVHPANHLVFFVAGVAMRLYGERLPRLGNGLFLVALTVAGLAAFGAALGADEQQMVIGWRRAALVGLSLGVVALVGGCAISDRWIGFCALMAGLSYPLYLIHPILYVGVKSRMAGQPLAVLGLLAVAVLLAIAVDRYVDAPLQRRLKKAGW
jgi:exopolysaccharide production protein ExoZ